MESYLTYLTVFIGVLTVASAAQAVILFFIFRRVTKLAAEVEKTVARLSDQSKAVTEQVVRIDG